MQYADRPSGDILHWQGQTEGRTDRLITDHEKLGFEYDLVLPARLDLTRAFGVPIWLDTFPHRAKNCIPSLGRHLRRASSSVDDRTEFR